MEGNSMNHKKQHNTTLFRGLSPAQENALAALLAGNTVTAAAEKASVDRTTIYHWLRNPYDPTGAIPVLRSNAGFLRASGAGTFLTAN